jgi:SPX domain protein involved in polyphosphate accumulation
VSFRKEKKFRVTVSEFHKLQSLLQQRGMKALFKSRIINSVYLDTVDMNMFHDSEEGVLPRKKVRIRWYDESESLALENKTSSIEGRFKVTSNLDIRFTDKKLIRRNRMDAQYGLIQPILKVSYERSYFELNKMRITFDKNITYQYLRHANNRKYYEPERVVEIKIPIKCSDDYVEKHIPYPTARFSKYSRGILLLLGDLNEV